MGWTVQCSDPGRDKRIFCHLKRPHQLWDSHTLLFNGPWGSLPVVKQPGCDFDHHLHEKLRSKEVKLYLYYPTCLHHGLLNLPIKVGTLILDEESDPIYEILCL
jgi:hypothetical protein